VSSEGVIIVAKTVLHVGPGSSPLPPWIETEQETRFDIDARNEPDIVGDMCAMGEIGQYDVVVACHVLEHVTLPQARKALSEFKRVLAPKGLAIIVVPDLEDVRPTSEILYESELGPVSGLDMFYGMQSAIAEYPHMAHKYGYVSATLHRELTQAGFTGVTTSRDDGWNLVGFGVVE